MTLIWSNDCNTIQELRYPPNRPGYDLSLVNLSPPFITGVVAFAVVLNYETEEVLVFENLNTTFNLKYI